jgi:predicted RNA-binding protein
MPFGMKDAIIKAKIRDFVNQYVAASNKAEAMDLLDDAFEDYEAGILSVPDAEKLLDTLLELARPEERADLEKMLAQNRGMLVKYLAG